MDATRDFLTAHIDGHYVDFRERTDWIETYTGRQFWPLTPRPEDVSLLDIAHALGAKCRFSGHCNPFYSVAEHSWIVSHQVPHEHAKEALMHDAAEAYLADISSPIKPHLIGWKEIEQRVEEAIFIRFGLMFPFAPCIKEIDRRMVVTERRQIMSPSSRDWKTHKGVEPLDLRLGCWTPTKAASMFMQRANELGLA